MVVLAAGSPARGFFPPILDEKDQQEQGENDAGRSHDNDYFQQFKRLP